MSVAQVYITTAIHNLMGSPDPADRTPAVIRGQITQFTGLKIAIPRKNYRTADITVNLLSDELPQFYTEDDPTFETYRNFLYIKWRSHLLFWGPILIKELDFEGGTMTLHAKDQAARLEKNFFKIGDEAMDGTNPTGPGLHFPFASHGHLEVGWNGIQEAFQACSKEENTRIFTDINLQYPAFVPFGVRMGSNDHTSTGKKITIERGQEIWRTILDLGDRTDGPLVDFVPLDVSDGRDFAVCNVYGQFRDDVSATVKLHYNTGLNNLRNIQPSIGGEVLSHVNTVSNDKRWNVYSLYLETGRRYGIWLQWEQVDWSLDLNSTRAEVRDSLGAVGDAVLDAYGLPLISLTLTMRHDDEIGATGQFHYIDDFKVADIVEIGGAKGPESFSGKYLIDEFRLEQDTDGSGEMQQNIDVIPWVQVGDRTYRHLYTKSRPDTESPA